MIDGYQMGDRGLEGEGVGGRNETVLARVDRSAEERESTLDAED